MEDRIPDRTSLSRVMQNISWLLGGKGFVALCSIGYLAVLARSLGVKDFGHFALITGTGQALGAIAGFQTWRVVVRYGVGYVQQEEWASFGRLVWLCILLDAFGATLGTAIAAGLIYGFGHVLGLNPAYANMAFFYSAASLWALTSAMTGVMRTLGRFDAVAFVESLLTISRLLLALAIWKAGPTVSYFLIAWAMISFLEAGCYFLLAKRFAPEALNLKHVLNWRAALSENDRINSFFWFTFCSSTLNAGIKQGPLLAVGAFVGTSAAGLYRLTSQMTQALSKLSTLITQALYPEITRASVTDRRHGFRHLALRISLLAGCVAAIVIGLAVLIGSRLLELIGGPSFSDGAPILVPLAIAVSFELASVAFEPVLQSTGHAHLSFSARLLALISLGVGLWLLIPTGVSGVGWAVALAGLVSYVSMGALAWNVLHKRYD